jgi:serine/threonine-protein kinase
MPRRRAFLGFLAAAPAGTTPIMAPTSLPEQIGAYVIEHELGRGAHGVVYRAHHREAPTVPVALKVVESRGQQDRLLLEPTLLSQLDHPCIVGLRDYFVVGRDLAIALEYLGGEDLKSMLDRGATFNQAEVRDLLVQLASALAHAHQRGIIHRDIKPGNILVIPDGPRRRFVLTDFGISRQTEGIQLEKHTGGTYLFMAPEQLRGRPGPQSDLWALGAVAYRLLTGGMPFPGPSLAELTRQIYYGTPPGPGPLCPEPLDPKLEAVVLRLLDKSLQERVGSAEELLRELGYRGSPEEVLSGVGTRQPRAPARTVLDRQLTRGIAWRWVVLVLALAVNLLAGGVVSGALLLLGMAGFFWGQARNKRVVTFGALTLMGAHLLLRYIFPDWDTAGRYVLVWAATGISQVQVWLTSWLGPSLRSVLVILFAVAAVLFALLMLFLPVVVGTVYVSLRRLQRQRQLRQVALAGNVHSEQFLTAFRESLDSRFEDVDFHLKYAETLFDGGRVKEAAVEARLLLIQDPYHFGGNLLLAHAYHQLGLTRDCLEVCDAYLAVSGYCFEFSELRDECCRRLGVS